MKWKNNLDEMQEQELLKIEHNGCWLAFWLLVIALVVETFFFGDLDFRVVIGEWAVLMILAIYLAVACARRGIWDRRIPMTGKANLVISLIAGAANGIFRGVVSFKNYHKPAGSVAAGIFSGAMVFVVCFVALTLAMRGTRKKKDAMEAEPSDADEL